MNELLFISVTLIALSLVVFAIKLGPSWTWGLIVALLLLANIFAAKWSIVFGVVSSLAIPLYAAIFLATDALSENFGKQLAYKAVWMGFIAQVCLIVFGLLINSASSIDATQASAEALKNVFGFIPKIVLGSFVAYIVSQNFDVYVFHKLKDATEGRHLWLRNCLTTMVAQAIDSVIFIAISFWGRPNIIEVILSVWIVKVIVALADTPFIYLTRIVARKQKPSLGLNSPGQ